VSYYYWIQASGAGGTAHTAISGNTIASIACTADLSSSDKDIISKNGTAINYVNTGGPPQACNHSTDSVPTSTTFSLGNVLSFQINLCNNINTSKATASNITVTDTLLNLQIPSSGWNAKYNGVSITPTVTGSAPNQVLTFNLTAYTIPKNTVSTITFDAQLFTAATGNSSRFENTFSISYNNGASQITQNGNTPLLPFYIGSSAPVIKEVP